MDGIPITDPLTGKVLAWDPETQSAEWCDFSEVVEERMEFDEAIEGEIADITDEDRHAFEAAYKLPDHFLDDYDHLFRFLSFLVYIRRVMLRVPKNHQSVSGLKTLIHALMVRPFFKHVSLDDFAYLFMNVVEDRPDIAALLKGEKE